MSVPRYTLARHLRVCLALVIASAALAISAPGPSAAQAQDEPPLDLVIVLDNSGSMRYPDKGGADLKGLRYDAARMLVDLVSERDRVNVVHFSREARALLPALTLMDEAGRTGLKSQIEQIRIDDPAVPPDATNYGRALDTALKLFPDPPVNRGALIFLTDGEPTDLEGQALANRIAPLRARGVTVFLMVLSNSTTADIGKLDATRRIFREQTAVPPVDIDGPADIAQAFARALTQLQPSLYLDTLEGIAAGPASTRFSAAAGPVQRIREARFIFAPANPEASFTTSVDDAPANASVSGAVAGDGPARYHTFVFGSADNQPIDGVWSFTSSSAGIAAFVLVRSDLRIRLAFPQGEELFVQRAMIPGQPLPIAALGLPDQQAPNVKLYIHRGGCPSSDLLAAGGDELDVNSGGLSVGTPVYWQRIDAPSSPIGVSIALRLVSPPALARCFTFVPAEGVSGGIDLAPPETDQRQRTLLVRALPPLGLSEAHVYGFLAAPAPASGVAELAIDPSGRGVTQPLQAAGDFALRYIAEGRDARGLATVTYAEQSAQFVPALSPSDDSIDLTISQLGEPLVGSIALEAPLIQPDAIVSFSAEEPRDEAGAAVLGIAVELCQRPRIGADSVECPFTIRVPDQLEPGTYTIPVTVDAPEQPLTTSRLSIRLSRHASGLTLDQPSLHFDQPIGPTTAALTRTLRFSPRLWRGDPQLEGQVVVEDLVNVTTQEELGTDQIAVSIRPTGAAEALEYDLVLQPRLGPDAEDPEQPALVLLSPGTYRARLAFRSPLIAAENLPRLTISFERPAAQVRLGFASQSYSDPLLGILPLDLLRWTNQWTSYLPVSAESAYTLGAPDLPAPTVVSVRRRGDTGSSVVTETVQLSWRPAGVVEDEPDTYRYLLALDLKRGLPPGEYEVQFSTAAPIVEPPTATVVVRVEGWGALLWRLVPWLIGAGVVLLLVRALRMRVVRAFRGELLINGKGYPLSGTRDLYLVKDAQGVWRLSPQQGNARLVVRCINQQEIEVVVFGTPMQRFRLKCEQRHGTAFYYRCGGHSERGEF